MGDAVRAQGSRSKNPDIEGWHDHILANRYPGEGLGGNPSLGARRAADDDSRTPERYGARLQENR